MSPDMGRAARKTVSIENTANFQTDISSPVPNTTIRTRATHTIVQRLLRSTIIAHLISPAHAYNSLQCCMTRARQFVAEYDDAPWVICGAGVVDPWSHNPPFPQVNATLAWCVEHCPGYASVGLDQWLHPVAQWFVPYATLLFLCPIGDTEEEAADKGLIRRVQDYFSKKVFVGFGEDGALPDDSSDELLVQHDFTKRFLEWMNILGDPASAVWGAISQLSMDWWIVRRLKKLDDVVLQASSTASSHDKEILGVVVMAGQTAMNADLGRVLTKQLVLQSMKVALDVLIHPNGEKEDVSLETPAPNSPDRALLDLQKLLSGSDSRYDTSILDHVDDIGVREMSHMSRDMMKTPKDFLQAACGKVQNSTSNTASTQIVQAALRSLKDRDNIQSTTASPNYESPISGKIRKAIRSILEARRTFVTAIALPVVIHFATTAQVFYESYQKMGDSSTAHGLAYGALYSWLLLIAVIGNCAAVSANAGVIQQQIQSVFGVSRGRVPLRARYANTLEWECWLVENGCDSRLKTRVEEARVVQADADTRIVAFKWFYAKYLLGQLVGWVTVAFFCACAATISYTTPTVGWGCRSFNHLMYGILSLVVALLQVAKHKAQRIDEQKHLNANKSIDQGHGRPQQYQPSEPRTENQNEKTDAEITEIAQADQIPSLDNVQSPTSLPKHSPPRWRTHRLHPLPKRSFRTKSLRALYLIFTILNFAVLLVGTILNWAGVYTTCRCKHIFGPATHPLELGGNTQLALDMARKYWNSTGYVVYLVAWCVCAVAVVVRQVLQGTLELEFMDGAEIESEMVDQYAE